MRANNPSHTWCRVLDANGLAEGVTERAGGEDGGCGLRLGGTDFGPSETRSGVDAVGAQLVGSDIAGDGRDGTIRVEGCGRDGAGLGGADDDAVVGRIRDGVGATLLVHGKDAAAAGVVAGESAANGDAVCGDGRGDDLAYCVVGVGGRDGAEGRVAR